tara:strand:+ start:1564 stop:2811 length:1248 start_codon:yes stop_codon:yes gene_type:complete
MKLIDIRSEGNSLFKIGEEVRAVFFWIFLWVLLEIISPISVSAQKYDMPNQGSPYVDLEKVGNGKIVHLPTGLKVDFEGLIDSISGSRVIYVGETHDNLAAHKVQLKIIRALEKKFSGHLAVGMEMFRLSAQEAINRWREGNLQDREFKKLFYRNWGGDYRLYRNIFSFIREKGLPLLALKSNVETQAKFKKEGELNPDGFPELDLKDFYHEAYSRSVFGGHSDHNAKHDPYRTLTLWEETMAETVSKFLRNEGHSDWKLIVLAGGFHVQYGFGIPKRAFRRVPHSYSIILPMVTEIPPELSDRRMDVKKVAIPLYSADFVWKLPYEILPDNKVKLGVFLEELEEGILVKSVKNYGAAARAGVLKNDLLLQLDGRFIIGVDDLVDRLQEVGVGGKGVFRIRRAGTEIDVAVVFNK